MPIEPSHEDDFARIAAEPVWLRDLAGLSPAGRQVVDDSLDHHYQLVRPARIAAEIRGLAAR